MKKIILWILTLCIVVSTCIFPVSASETNSVGVSVIYTEKKHITPDNAYYDHGDNTRSSAVHDLLENGKIIEAGSHDDLMKLSGRYATLYNYQAEKFST